MMVPPLTAIEATGTIDEQQRLCLDETLPVHGPQRVRVLVLYPLSDEISEEEWLKATTANPAFSDLADPEQDIYTLADGTPFHDEA